MKLSINFLKDYVDAPVDMVTLGEDMTNIGNEYDSAKKLVEVSGLTIGKIIECEMHPDSDHLHICKVDVGNEVLQIVCGAPNARVGIKVIVALVGAVLPDGTIKKGKLRGVESFGMLCSVEELGLEHKFLKPEDIEGIAELGEDAVVGEDPIKYLGLDDEVIDFELTSNRGDLLSVLGMAYELSAIYKKEVKLPSLTYNESNKSVNGLFETEIKTKSCPLFLAKKVENVEIKESPDFIKNELIASGIRPINNVVDISNYVMLELGQPLHFYDADKLGNKIIVRDADENEKLTTLDNIERTLSSDDIVISNEEKAVGLAGVMGGLDTEVTENTKNIIIESAIFDSIKVRKTSKKILRSEASNRFEKGLDPNRTYMAIERSCHLLEKYANATILKDMIVYDTTTKTDKVIEVGLEKINNVLGLNLNINEVENIFKDLGFKVEINNNNFTVTVPTRRLDINIKEDLIEEVGRIYGMDKIEGKLPMLNVVTGSYNKTRRDIKNKLVDLGLNETLSYTLIPKEEVKKYTLDDFIEVTLADPMSEDKNTLRYSLLPSLKEIYEYNKAHNQYNISIFEMGKGFYKEEDKYKENNKLAILMSGDYYIDINNEKVDFYVIKGILEELMEYLGYDGRYRLNQNNEFPKEFHKGQSAIIELQGKPIGIIGKLHPSVAKDVYVMEIDLDKMFINKSSKMTFREIPKYPEIEKDMAFIVDKEITSGSIIDQIKKTGGKLLTDIKLFDLYEGENVGENKKSLAFKLTFNDLTKTLNDEEVMVIFNKIINEIEKQFNAELRNK